MKKLLLIVPAMFSLCMSVHAVNYADWVQWDEIRHWAGDPNGTKKCALVIDFQDEFDNRGLVWGFRWNGTATGEDLMRAVASQSSCFTAMIQYTGTMGSTLNGLGISPQRGNLDELQYDFERAAVSGEVSFGYFEPNTTMGQEDVPGYAAYDMCTSAIGRAKTTGIIEHPLNAFRYGYPAYDYDYWKYADETFYDYTFRWRAGWYDGYWSYWHGPNDYDYMGYSGLGMSSTLLTDGCVQAWKYISFNGSDIGYYGGELAEELNYDLSDFDEEMHEAPSVTQPVDQSRVQFWVGSGEKAATVVFQFNDGLGPDNIVYGYRWSGGWDDNLLTVIDNIAKADPRMSYVDDSGEIKITFDSERGSNAARSTSRWNCYVKRVIDEDFVKVNAGRWLNPNAVMVVSNQSAEMASVNLPYQLFRPAISDTPTVSIPESITYAVADQRLEIPIFIELPEGATWQSGLCNRDQNIKNVTLAMNVDRTNNCAYVTGFKNFNPTTGKVSVKCTYKLDGATKSESITSNECELSLLNPVRPITSIRYETSSVDARLSHPVENNLIIEPANATYTKIAYKSSNTRVAGVNSGGMVTTYKTEGEATITASYDLNAYITSSYTLSAALRVPVEDVTFAGVSEDGVITLTPKEMIGLFPIFSPADPDIHDVKVELTDNGSAKDNYLATMYQVNIWDADGKVSRPYELSGHRVGECKLTVTPQDGTGFSKEFTVRIVEPERDLAIDYNTGTIMLNEEWYGHTNGGLNWYSPEYDIVYQAYERENPGMSFGATSQYGITYDGKLIVMSKQDVDGGDPLPGGGRIVIADASTLKRLGSINNIIFGDETRSQDGRAVVGAGPGRVYAGTNNGVYIVDINNFEIIGKVAGEISDGDDNGRPNTDPSSSLYQGQIGDMVLAGNHVFVTRQDNGVYIIDIDTDRVVKIINDKQVQGITQSADGRVWYATLTDNKKQSIFVALDINTLEENARIEVPAEIGAVTCGWGAWRTTQFTSSHSLNALFFCPGSSITNGGAGIIYRYDIDDDKFTRLAQVSGLDAHSPGQKQGAYGTIRYDDRTGEIIAGTTEFKASGHYRYNWTHFIDAQTGEFTRSIELRPYYWFQAHAIFPDAYAPELEDIDDISLDINDPAIELTVNATDRDNNDANIRYALASMPHETDSHTNVAVADVKLRGNILTVTPQSVGSQAIGLSVESNGRVIRHAFNVTVSDKTAMTESVAAECRSIAALGRSIRIKGYDGVCFRIIDMAGSEVDSFTAVGSDFVYRASLPDGIYVMAGDSGVYKKIIVK